MSKIIPTQEWLNLYESKQDILSSVSDFNEYFSLKEMFDKPLHKIEIGRLPFPTGELLVRDPLIYLQKNETPYLESIPNGNHPLTLLVVELEEDYFRYVATRLKTKDTKAIKHKEALLGNEDLVNFKEGEYFGFNVDAGLATIVDVSTKDAYCNFVENWIVKNPESNIYDNYFADQFKQNAIDNPKYQREAGDWINFKIPNTELYVPMIQTGFGDGIYPVYFGFDENNEICEVVTQFIDLELTFDDEEDE